MKKFRFLDWQVYKDSKKLFREILPIIDKLPQGRRIELGGQIVRSAQSIVLNIAEGSGKASDKELNRFVEIALGSAYETLAGLDILRENNLMSQVKFVELEKQLSSICGQLGGFKKVMDVPTNNRQPTTNNKD